MSKNVPGQAASGQADLGVLQEEGQCLGQGVQLAGTDMLQEVALPHEVMLEEVLTLRTFTLNGRRGSRRR